MTFLNYADIRNAAATSARMPKSLGPPATIGERLSRDFEAAVTGQLASSEGITTQRAIAENMSALEELTGDDFAPIRDRIMETAVRQGQGLATPDVYADVVETEVRSFIEAHPDKADRFSPNIRERAYELSREAGIRAEQAAARTDSLLVSAAGLAGSLGAFVYDPVTYAGLLFGGPAISAGRGLVSRLTATAGREAAIGTGLEAAAQPAVQEYRARAGLDSGFWLGVQNAVFAGVASGALSAAWRGAIEAGGGVADAAGRIMHRYRTDPEFREGLTPQERAALDANDADAANLDASRMNTPTLRDAEEVRAAVSNQTEEMAIGLPVRPVELDPLLIRPLERPRLDLDRILGDSVPADFRSAMVATQRSVHRAVQIAERAMTAARAETDLRPLAARQAAELSDAQRVRAELEDELEVINAAVNRLRQGEAPENTGALREALDPDTANRLLDVEAQLDRTGLPKRQRRALERERETILRSVGDETLPRLEARADELARTLETRRGEEADLREGLRALRRADVSARRRVRDTKARHEQIRQEGRAPGPQDVADHPGGFTPYRARRVAEAEQHFAAAEARVNNPEAAAQRAVSRIEQEVETTPPQQRPGNRLESSSPMRPGKDDASWSGTVTLRHGRYEPPGEGRPLRKFEGRFTGVRYDGNAFGDAAIYLDADGKWTSNRIDRFEINRVYEVEVTFDNAFVLTPETASRLGLQAQLTGGNVKSDLTGEEIARLLRTKGHDGIIVEGFDKRLQQIDAEAVVGADGERVFPRGRFPEFDRQRDEVLQRLVDEGKPWNAAAIGRAHDAASSDVLALETGLPEAVLQDQVIAFKPRNVRVKGLAETPFEPVRFRPEAEEPEAPTPQEATPLDDIPELPPQRTIFMDGRETPVDEIRSELNRQQSIVDAIKECRGG